MAELGMDDARSMHYERYNGYESEAARAAKMRTQILIAGLGGGGAELALLLAKEGYASFSLIDADTMGPSDFKIPFVNSDVLGRLKVDAVKEQLLKINPTAEVRIFPEWFGARNAERFFTEGVDPSRPRVAIDEIDLLRGGPTAALIFAQTARRHGIPLTTVTDIGKRGAVVTSFGPTSTWTYERLHGLQRDVSPAEVSDRDFAFSTIGYLPTYGSIDTLRSVLKGAPLPSAPGSVHVGSVLGASEVERIVLAGRFAAPSPTWAPRIRWVDVEGGMGASRFPSATYWVRLAKAVLYDKILRKNPPASYKLSDIEARKRARSEAN